ncbi:MAG: TetR/AcrR family transcriptional regulator, partial [Candidatus Thorarchaeota archaeon]
MPKVVPEYKEKAKKRIMMHAAELFSEKGYYKTKMIDIAESMGVSKGA